MDVFWLEQSEANVPATDDWLSESEALKLTTFRVPKRRTDWRSGRWTAKCAVAACLQVPADRSVLRLIEISAASTGQPEVTVIGRHEPTTISISHRNGIAICAVAVGNVALGCDLEAVEPRSDAFISDYFTAEEQSLIALACSGKQPTLVSLLWSAKESALKALHVGLRADLRSARVEIEGPQIGWFINADVSACEAGGPAESFNVSCNVWYPLRVHFADGADFRGWWQRTDNIVRTVVADPPPAVPVELSSRLLGTATSAGLASA